MKKQIVVIFLTISSVVVIFHLLGFKLFGEATLVENQPLKNPEKISSITAKGTILLANGKEYDIYGITTILPSPLEQIRYLLRMRKNQENREPKEIGE